MIRRYMLLCSGLCLMFVALSFTNVGTTIVEAQLRESIVEWDFENDDTVPSVGTGTLTPSSGLTGITYFGGSPGRAWSASSWSQTASIDTTRYVQITTSTTGYTAIQLSFDTRRSGQGARDYEIHYSTDGTSFTKVADNSASITETFATHGPFDFSSITALNNQPTIYLRIYGYNATGTGNIRLDDVTITGISSVPVAPAVVSTTPADGATNVSINGTITVNFNQIVNVTSAAAFSFDCPAGVPQGYSIDTLTGSSITITPAGSLPPNTICEIVVIASRVSNSDDSLNMATNYTFSLTTEPNPITVCAAPTTPIENVTTGTVTVKGVVTADYETVGGTPPVLNGFYMQDQGVNPALSDGIFVYTGTVSRNVSVGDEVVVTGSASVYQGQRQISLSNMTPCGTSTVPAPTTVTLPVPAGISVDDYYKRYEGMLVQFADTLTVTELYQFGRFGQMTLSQGGRLTQFTQFNTPSVAGYTNHLDEKARRSIILDDLSQAQNVDPIFPDGGFSLNNLVRGGYTMDDLTGILTYTWGGNEASPNAWRVRPVDNATYTFNASNPRATTPPNVGGTLQVAAMNVLNYFVTTGTGYQCGPAGTTQCRGADNATELVRQQDKLVSALCTMDASVIGLMEIENPRTSDATDAPVSALTNALNNASINCGTYDFIHTGTIGGDAIKNALIYQPAEVTPIGPFFILDDEFPFNANTRPPLAQVFEDNASGERFIAVINHFKSKSCNASAVGANADLGDGQSCWNGDRVTAATVMVDWLDEIQTTTGVNRVVILGDLNSQAQEDPMQVLYNAGYSNLYDLSEYGYVFDGMWGTMDYALGNPAFTANVTGARSWNINADEASIVDYNTNFKSASQIANYYNADPFRSSDHDPVLVGLNLNAPTLNVDDAQTPAGSLVNGAIYNTQLDNIQITFSHDVFNTTFTSDPNYADSASNPANYILLAEGALSGFQTVSCAAGVSANDNQIIPASVNYNASTFTTTLTFSPALENGSYRLLICGTTSIVLAANTNVHLNNGIDVVRNFTVNTTAPVPSATPAPGGQAVQPEDLGVSQLPATGETPLWAELLNRFLGW